MHLKIVKQTLTVVNILSLRLFSATKKTNKTKTNKTKKYEIQMTLKTQNGLDVCTEMKKCGCKGLDLFNST